MPAQLEDRGCVLGHVRGLARLLMVRITPWAQPRPGAHEDRSYSSLDACLRAALAANAPLHSSSLVTYPSATTSLTLSLVIACGVSRTRTGRPCRSRVLDGDQWADPCSPLASATASAAAASASLLDRLVDGHALVAVEDVLPGPATVASWPVTGTSPLSVVLLEDGDGRVAEAVVGGQRRRRSCRRPWCSICSKMVPACWLSQSGTDWSSTFLVPGVILDSRPSRSPA